MFTTCFRLLLTLRSGRRLAPARNKPRKSLRGNRARTARESPARIGVRNEGTSGLSWRRVSIAREERSDVCERVTESRRPLEANFWGRRPQAECVIQRSHCAASYAFGVTYGYERVLAVARRTERIALPATNSKPQSPRNRFPLVVQNVVYRVTGLSYFDRGRVGMRYFIQPVSHRHVCPTGVSLIRLKRIPS